MDVFTGRNAWKLAIRPLESGWSNPSFNVNCSKIKHPYFIVALLSDGNARTQALNGPLAGIYQKMFTFHGLCLEWPRRDMLGSEALLAKLQTLNSGGQKRRQFDTEWAIRAFPTGAFFQLFPLIDTRKGRNSAERKIIGWEL